MSHRRHFRRWFAWSWWHRSVANPNRLALWPLQKSQEKRDIVFKHSHMAVDARGEPCTNPNKHRTPCMPLYSFVTAGQYRSSDGQQSRTV
jgi:hypothetical protein